MCALCEAGGRGFHSTASDAGSAPSEARVAFVNPGKPAPTFGDGPSHDGPRLDGSRFDQGDFIDWFNGARPERGELGHFTFDWGSIGQSGGSLVDTLLSDQLGHTVGVKAPALDLASNFVVSDGSETEADSGPGSGQDGIAGNSSTTDVLTIGAPAVTNHINFNGDQDWYQVTLQAGHYYTFTMDPQGALDAVLQLINTNGTTVITSADGPLAEDTEVVTFYCETSGVYYLNADGFQTDIGTYTLQGVESPLPSPLDAINWGGNGNVVPGAADTVILIGGNGDDLLRGGNGADTFLFNAGLFGNDTIGDFADGTDLIEFDGIAGVDDFSDLVIAANGGNALITLPDGSTITLTGINSAVLDASDFVFGP